LWDELDDYGTFREYFYARYYGTWREGLNHVCFNNLTYAGLYGPYFGLKMLAGNNEFYADLNAYGFQGMEYKKVSYEDAVQRIAEHHSTMQAKNLPNNLRRLAGLARLCEQKGIRLVLIQLPVNQYYNKLKEDKYSKVNQASMAQLANQYKNVSVVVVPDSLVSEKDFHDADHLSISGAKKASLWLNKYLNFSENRAAE
jgi:hypothetical protein